MSKEPRLLFVNKDAANFKSKEHRAQVNSFVQKGLKHGKEERLCKLKASLATTRYSWRLGTAQNLQTRPQTIKLSANGPVLEARHADDSGHPEDVLESAVSTKLVQIPHQAERALLNDPMCMSTLQEQLDPFIRLAGKTTRHFTVTPAAVYGSSSTALYCPVRDTTVANMQSNHLWLQWVLLSAENFVMGVDAADKDVTHLLRKNYLYRSMQSVVSDSRTRFSDNTITALSFAGLIEARAGELEKGRKHLVASKTLIEDRGGIQTMPIALSFPVLTTFLWLGTGAGAFRDSHAVELAIQRFRNGVLQLQCSELDATHSSVCNSEFEICAYIRDLAFGPYSPLRPFIEGVHRDPSLPQQRSHAAILWVFNVIMNEQRKDCISTARFLNSFCRYVESSGGPDPSSLKAWTVVLALGFCGARHDAENGKDINDSVLRWWEAMDVVELLLLISEQSRKRVVGFLSWRLISSDESTSEMFTEKQLDQLASEMRFKWLEAKYG